MQEFIRHPLAVSVVASVALAGCFGGSSSSSSDDNGDTADLSPVTAENERDVSIAAAESVGAAGDSRNNLSLYQEALDDIDDSETQSQSVQSQSMQLANVPECDTNNVTIGEDGGTFRYSIDDRCSVSVNGADVELAGAYVFSFQDWNDSQCTDPTQPTEFIYGGDPEFTGEGAVNFRIEGGFGVRQATQIPDSLSSGDPTGDYCFNFEYGATSDGLVMESDARSFSLAPNSFTGVLVEATVEQTGGGDVEVTSLNQEFYTDGVFELAEGEFYEITFSQDLQTRSDEDTDSGDLDNETMQPGGQFCPSSGTMTVSGADETEVVVTFGDDVDGEGAAVKVAGEDTNYYATCDDFYDDQISSG